MNQKTNKRIPVNLISGPLGVGKTTTINHLLSHRPEGEKWAVLVNEYGLVGLDAALMETESNAGEPTGVDIREVAGGCICCSAGFMFEVSLVLLLQRKPARLLIEPTGLAALSGILDTLDRPGIRESVDVQSIICLLDPKRFREDLLKEQVQDQIEAADILIASRPDLATAQQRGEFHEWAHSLFPKKRWIGAIEQGRVPLDLLSLVADRQDAIPRGGHAHGTDHHHHHHHHHEHEHEHEHQKESDAHASTKSDAETPNLACDASQPIIQRAHASPTASTLGWVCWKDLIFDSQGIHHWLTEITRREDVQRTKAVIRTNDGWHAFNFTNDAQEIKPSSYRRDSRIEVIFGGNGLGDADDLEKKLRQHMINIDIIYQSNALPSAPKHHEGERNNIPS